MKKVILVVHTHDPNDKTGIANFQRKVKSDLSIQNKEICVEFYNQGKIDPLKIKFNYILKKRKPTSALFHDCSEITALNMIEKIEKKIGENVTFFFKNFYLKESTHPKLKKIESIKEMTIFLTV